MKYLRTGLLMTLVVSLVLPVSVVSANSSLDANTLSSATSSSSVSSNEPSVASSEPPVSDIKSAASSDSVQQRLLTVPDSNPHRLSHKDDLMPVTLRLIKAEPPSCWSEW